MTTHKHLKQRIRARMDKTGESYATARRQIIRSVEQEPANEKAGRLPARRGRHGLVRIGHRRVTSTAGECPLRHSAQRRPNPVC